MAMQNPDENLAQDNVEEVVEETTETLVDNPEADLEENVEEANEEITEETTDEASKESAEPEEDKKEDKKKKFKFKKDKRDEMIEELTDKNKRMLAEFENFRNRSEKEKSAMYEVGAKSVIEKILPVIDNFERGLAQVPEDEKETPFASGMEMIYKQMLTALEDMGVKPIEAVGTEFDPNFHNAVMHEENDEVGENIITEEFQKGYTYRDSVVRHSMVKVAN